MTKQLYVACGNRILEFDLRNLPSIVSTYNNVPLLLSPDV